MKLVKLNTILDDAVKNHYAVGAFNIINLETLRAVVNAAEAEKSPVILQIWHGDLLHTGVHFVSAMAQTAATLSSVPIVLQLDHGQSLEQALICMECGFPSIMIDFSLLDYSDNVKTTKKVVEEAHARGVTVEAELGKIYGGNDPVEVQTSSLTDPELAKRYVEETGIDALAVSIGTAHGFYSAKPDIRFSLLEKLIKNLPVPIVVHGGSDIPDEQIAKMVELGIAKLNVGTDLMTAFMNGLREKLVENEKNVIRDVLGYAQKKVEETTRKYIQLLNTYRVEQLQNSITH